MNDDDLRRALRSLRASRARPGFTARVLARTRAAEREPRWTPLRLGAAGAALVLALAAGVWLGRARPPAPETRLLELRAEQRNLEAELRAIERTAARAGPVLLLDAGETDLVLDLGELLRRRAETGGAAAPPGGAHR